MFLTCKSGSASEASVLIHNENCLLAIALYAAHNYRNMISGINYPGTRRTYPGPGPGRPGFGDTTAGLYLL